MTDADTTAFPCGVGLRVGLPIRRTVTETADKVCAMMGGPRLIVVTDIDINAPDGFGLYVSFGLVTADPEHAAREPG